MMDLSMKLVKAIQRQGMRHVSRRSMSIDSFSVSPRPYTPRRALMYVPGSDSRKVAKIPQLGADCVCLDCEDGVALNQKAAARENIRNILDKQEVDFGRSECSVRVNSIESGLCGEDLKDILGGPQLPSALHLPKVQSAQDLEHFSGLLARALLNRPHPYPPQQKLGLIMFIESAQALLDMPSICKMAWHLSESASFVPEAIVFGSDDFAADIGATRTKDSTELFYARQSVVTAAKAFRLQAIDCVYIDFKDQEGLRRQSEEGARWGFTGKQVIHPGQVKTVQEAFSPNKERLEWATQLVEEFNLSQEEGRGAFTFRGHMIDMPTVKQAFNVLEIKNKCNL